MGGIAIVCGSGSQNLAHRVAKQLDIQPTETRSRVFPDGELDIGVDPGVRNADVFVIDSLGPPVNDHLVELVMLADACRRTGAARLTAIVPYLAYARKDRRTSAGEAVGLAVVADLLGACVDGAVLVDPHVPQMDSIFGVPLEVVSAVPDIAASLAPHVDDDTVVIAPDLGAVALAERYAEKLELSAVTVVRKTRHSGSHVEATGLIGKNGHRRPLLVDDMISTGRTLAVAMEILQEHWSSESFLLAATHGLFVDGALERLTQYPLDGMVVTDSLPAPDLPPGSEVVEIAPLLAGAIRRIHGDGQA